MDIIQFSAEWTRDLGIIEVVGGSSSLFFSVFILICALHIKATHICTSTILYNFLILGIIQSVNNMVSGAFKINISRKGPLVFGDHLIFYGIVNFVDLFGIIGTCLFSLMIFYDSLRAFKNPLRIRLHYRYVAMFLYGLALALDIIMIFSMKTFYSGVIEFVTLWSKLIGGAGIIGFLLTFFILFFKLRQQKKIFKRNQNYNIIFKQVLRVQKWFCGFLVIFLIYSFLYLALMGKQEYQRMKPFHYISFVMFNLYFSILSLPFVFNIYKVTFVYPSELKNFSYQNITLSYIQRKLLLLVIGGIHDSFKQRTTIYRRMKRPSQRNLPSKKFLISENEYIELSDTSFSGSQNDNTESIEITFDETEFQSEFHDSPQSKVQETFSNVKFMELAPSMFEKIRNHFGVKNKEISECFSVKEYKDEKLKIIISQNSGSFQISSLKYKFQIQSIFEAEYKFLKENIHSYYEYIYQNPNTFLHPLYGAYQISFPKEVHLKSLYFVLNIPLCQDLFRNKKTSLLINIPPSRRELKKKHKKSSNVDWKTVSGQALESLLDSTDQTHVQTNCLKLGPEQKLKFMERLTKDVEFCKFHSLSNYELKFGSDLTKMNPLIKETVDDFLYTDTIFEANEFKNLFFIYYNEDALILKQICPTHAIEYHICNHSNLDQIEKFHILEKADDHFMNEMEENNFQINLSTCSTAFPSVSSLDEQNIIVNFPQVYLVNQSKHENSGEYHYSDWIYEYVSPFEGSCSHCNKPNHSNHIVYCIYTSNQVFIEEITSEEIHLNKLQRQLFQILFIWKKRKIQIWKTKFTICLVDYLQREKAKLSEDYGNNFLNIIKNLIEV